MIKLRQKALISLQNRAFWMSKQPFAIHFFLTTCDVCSVAITEIFILTQGSDYFQPILKWWTFMQIFVIQTLYRGEKGCISKQTLI